MLVLVLGALVVGITLGLLGSGGSAITVPLLVYMLGHQGDIAITESMAIVGFISLFAAVPYTRSNNVDWFSVIFFGIPGMAGTLIGAIVGGQVDDSVQLIVLGVVLLLAAGLMIRKAWFQADSRSGDIESRPNAGNRTFGIFDRSKMAVEGLLVGALTGFVGVGGGFLIVPALIVLAKLPIRTAIGTSLVIITAKSVVGFAKYQHVLAEQELIVDWWSIVVFSVVGTVAGNLGSRVNSKLNQRRLKQVFAVFLVLIGLFVVIKECTS